MSQVHRLPIVNQTESKPGRDSAPSGPGASGAHGAVAAAAGKADATLLQVGELARACGKTVRAIHHYEEIGLLAPHKRSKGRYRLYAPDAVARVRWIHKLHDMGMSLSEIRRVLASWERAPSAPDAMAEIAAVYEEKLREVREQISHLHSLERELLASLGYLDTCETCDPDELVAACSACTVHNADQPEPELVAGLYATTERAANP